MSDLTARLDATAREALGALLAYHRGHITRIEAALEALDGPVVPLVRPPAPDIEIAAPVEMPKVPQREQRPAAKVDGRIAANQAMSEKRVTCDNCGREFSGLGLGPHRRHCTPTSLRSVRIEHEMRTDAADASLAAAAAEPEPVPLRGPWTSEPITRMPIDHQAIRNVAAASL